MIKSQSIYTGVIGGCSCSKKTASLAARLGRFIAEQGWILVCGGRGGVMEAACRGAYSSGGVTIGILPGNSQSEGNPYLTYRIITGLGEMRNSLIVKTSNIIIALAGSFGTLSEIALANLHRVPVVGLDTWDIDSITNNSEPALAAKAKTPEQAVKMVKDILRL